MPKCFYCYEETNNFEYFTKCKCDFYIHYECWNKYLNQNFCCPICKKNTIILKIKIPKCDIDGNVIKNNKYNIYYILYMISIIYIFIVILLIKQNLNL